MFVALVFVYLICWLPHWIGQLFVCFLPDGVSVPQAYVLFSSCLAYLNSAINPFLYAFLTKNFFARLIQLVSTNSCKRQSNIEQNRENQLMTSTCVNSRIL